MWAFGRRHSGEVTAELLFSTFVTGGVLGVLAASMLDSWHSIALLLALVLTGTPYQYQLMERGYEPEPTSAQTELFTVLSWAGLIVVSLIGLAWLLVVRRRADQEDRAVVWRIPWADEVGSSVR